MHRHTTGAALALMTTGAFGGIQHMEVSHTLQYTIADLDTTRTLEIDIDGRDGFDLEFQIYNSFGDQEYFIAGLDSTRNGGFITDFDDNDYGVLRTFEMGEEIGPALEDHIGYETLSYADYSFYLGGGMGESGGYLTPGTHILGFSFMGYVPDPDNLGEEIKVPLYGWMEVEFGDLIVEEEAEAAANGLSNVFVRVTQIAYATGDGESLLAGQVPAPGALALLGLGGLVTARRKR